MVIYKCDCCDIITNLKSNYNRHLLSKRHLAKEIQSSDDKPSMSTDIVLVTNNNEGEDEEDLKKDYFSCEYCDKKFKQKKSVWRHIKYSCVKNKDEDLKELVRLLNLQIEQHRDDSEKKDKLITNQQKQIDRLMDKLQVPHQVNNNTTNNIQHNHIRLSYKETNISHLTDRDYRKAINNIIMCVKTLVEIVHLDPNHPENMNIYVSNLKDKYIMVYTGETWELKNRQYEINHLYDHNEMLLSEWLKEHGTRELRDKFEKYLSRKDGAINMIHEEIKLMLYNNRHTVESICE
jgi:uncharacterized C2H2 Zn-finger protein